ncbi:hypothetical protein [Streptomyces gobiensis]|uniref:hypothetical protein n=1 Tax=Streptomyces gobiensis TaxID=2875706 RepID=UPI001E3380E0|nr:hypothetical protein [Streptomyces gobiensis]UGY91564.1 hypothetical protein test1122_07385 [Streptomyces gobiensis]
MPEYRTVALTSLVASEQLDADPWIVDEAGQMLMCRTWAREHGGHEVNEQISTAKCGSGEAMLWGREDDPRPLMFITPSQRVLDIVMADPAEFAEWCGVRGAVLRFADMPEPVYTREMRATLYRQLQLPTEGAPTLWRGDDLYARR